MHYLLGLQQCSVGPVSETRSMTQPLPDSTIIAPECSKLHGALLECHRRLPSGPPRDFACRHLNRAVAQCLVSVACPQESEMVRNLCASGGTALKRSQCQQAELKLAVCLASHQQQG